MNFLDIAVLILIAFCAFSGYRRGLIRTVYRLASFVLAGILANVFYPYVARFLRGTAIFDAIQGGIKTRLNLGEFVAEYAAGHQEIIDTLPIPAGLRGLLNTQFDENVHGILRVDTIEEYVSAFFSNIAINGIALVLVFLLVFIGLSIVGKLLDIVGKLPVIRTFNNYGGLAVGILLGVGITWISIVAMSMFFATSANPGMYDLLQNSAIAGRIMNSMMPRLVSVA